MFVAEGALERLRLLERERFLKKEWPGILQKIQRLGFSPEQLLQGDQDA